MMVNRIVLSRKQTAPEGITADSRADKKTAFAGSDDNAATDLSK